MGLLIMLKKYLMYDIMKHQFRFAIPTYKRYQSLGEKTLKTLEKFGIDKSIIDIFVNTQEEYEIYKPLYPDYNLIVGELGIKAIREFIVNHYNEGDKIVCIDDDISDIKMKNPKSWEETGLVNIKDYPDTSLLQELDLGFEYCVENKTVLWGIYPCDNHGFMKNEVSTHLLFCGGWLYGMIIDKEVLGLDSRTTGNYDDFERSIKVFKKYGKVIRLNYLCAKTKYLLNAGGANIGDRKVSMLSDLECLKEKYGEYLIL